MANYASRAYFYAPIKRKLFIELPAEDKDGRPGEVGRLNVCLYGTRDAAKQWQDTLSAHLQSLGFKRGKGYPAVFVHPIKNVMTLVHGDDYVSAGEPQDLTWIEGELAKRYEIQTPRTGEQRHARPR